MHHHAYCQRKTVKSKLNRGNAEIFSLMPLSWVSEDQEIVLCFLRGDFIGTVSLISQSFALIFCVLFGENVSGKFCYTDRSVNTTEQGADNLSSARTRER